MSEYVKGDNANVQPYIPTKSRRMSFKTTSAAGTKNSNKKVSSNQNLSLYSLTKLLVIGAISSTPATLKSIAFKVMIVVTTNMLLQSINPWRLSIFMEKVLTFIIFITASYNPIVPRAIFWTIIMTIGTKLFYRIKANGITAVVSELKQFIPNFKSAWSNLGKLSISILLMGGGIGFTLSNYLTRNNRFNKMLVCYVVGIAIVDSLSRGHKSLIFLYIQAGANDIMTLLKKNPFKASHHTYLIGIGVSLGLYLNSIFSLTKSDNGGYILGNILIVCTILYIIYIKNEKETLKCIKQKQKQL